MKLRISRTDRRWMLSLLLIAGSAMPMSSALAQSESPIAKSVSPAVKAAGPDVPIRKITLYRSGVGYFERSGSIDNNAEIQLRFNTDQINDILKSMVLLDLDGGRVESVSYGSKEPLNKRLASFGINIADNPSASDILQRLRGTPVRVTSPTGEISGVILNVETRPTVYRGGSNEQSATVHSLPWINVVTKDGVRSMNLADATGFEILDKALADELNKALGALAEYRADRSKTVDVRFSGQGSRRVVLGYVHEMPVWKTSYRVVLPDVDPPAGDAGKKQGQVVVQGWAVVENTTDQDWNNVQLSLVSGRPVSFQMDLYEPLFTFRPWVPVPTIPGVMPRAYAAGRELKDKADVPQIELSEMRMTPAPAAPGLASSMAENASMSGFAGRRSGRGSEAAKAINISADDMANYGARSQATAGEVGEVFQFQLDAPVSIERQRSAMLPILTANMNGRRVSIYNPGDNPEHPMRGVELVNDAGLQMLPGPMAVFDGAAYAGDAQIGQVSKGEKRLLAYAVDLDTHVETKNDSNAQIVRLRIVDGLFEQTTKTRTTNTYTFDNKDPKRGRSIVLEQVKNDGWDLVETAKPAETTQSLYRFDVDVPAGKSQSFTVKQERTEATTIGVTSVDLPTIVSYHKAGKVSDRVLDAIRQVAAKQSAINDTEAQINRFTQTTQDISTDQGRIRENMKNIDRNTELYKRFMTKLTDQETQLEDLKTKKEAAQAKLTQQRSELNEFLRTLSAE